MRIFNLYEDDAEHQQVMKDTGFWGKQGAGLLFFSTETKRFCFSYRSKEVLEPNTWGTWGGACDRGESPEQTARREAHEETGLHINLIDLVHVYTFIVPDKFKYTNYVGIVETEFKPVVENNWEVDGFKWVEYNDWPSPLHPGMQTLLNDSSALEKLEKISQS